MINMDKRSHDIVDHTQYENVQDSSGPNRVTKELKTGFIVQSRTVSNGEQRLTPKRILKNVVVISLVFNLLFISYDGLANLQSSLHIDQGLGVVTQAVLYAALVISCLFVPKLLINKIGHKWTIPVSMISYILWMAANGYGVWATMLPASLMVGVSAAPLWTAKCSYFTLVAHEYAKLKGESTSGVLGLFFGIFFGIFRVAGMVGSIISTTILSPKQHNYSTPTEDEIALCGVNDCPYFNQTNVYFEKPPDYVVWTLVGIYIGVALVGFIVSIVFVDPLPKYLIVEAKPGNIAKDIWQMCTATLRNLRHINQVLIIILTVYSGSEITFFSAEYNKSWVTCNLGIWSLGLIKIPKNLLGSITGFACGRLIKYIGRIPGFVSGFLVDLCIQLTLMFWKPHPDDTAIFFVLSALWGYSDAIWQTQINALYGDLFPRESEAAFSNYRMWESVGFMVGFGYSVALCTSTKLYIFTATLLCGMMGYAVVEFRDCRKRQRTGRPI